MRLLADTHVLLWALSDSPRLPQRFRDAFADPATGQAVSAVTLAEIAIKRAVGKLVVPDGIVQSIHDAGFDPLPFDEHHATVLDGLPLHHRDPFDRMLVAQALAEDLVFLTVDPRCLRYDMRTL